MMCLALEYLTGDHSKQLKTSLYVVQNYQFLFKIVIGEKWTVIKMLSRKNEPI